jgi:site-specific DNA-cytosine methylase
MIVLSLFNGMNTGRQALENIGIKVEKYYSSEIKPEAIKLTQYHFPDTIQVGDVTKWKQWDIDWKNVDLILSGSPCQDLSIAGKQMGINGDRSGLFFVFVEILEHVKKLNPKVLYLQENVGSANKLDIGIMSRALGIYPVRFNSSLVTAQMRDRYYWTNIKTKNTMFDVETDIPEPKDKNILLQDILENGIAENEKHICLLERITKSFAYKDVFSDKAQAYLIKRSKKKFVEKILMDNGKYRIANQNELEVLQGFPKGYTSILTYFEAGSLLGDGWTLPIIEHIFKYINKNESKRKS